MSDLLDLIGNGASFEEILENYSDLETDDILTAVEYAARQTGVRFLVDNQLPLPKDDDFLTVFSKAPTARLLWVRPGNCRRTYLLETFRRLWPAIHDHFTHGERLVEIR